MKIWVKNNKYSKKNSSKKKLPAITSGSIKLSVYITLFILLGYCLYLFYFQKEYETIHIALVSSLSGPDALEGQSFLNAILLCIKEYNDRHGNKKKIICDIYDDQNIPSKARKIAEEIVQKKFLAVIGHNLSSCSLAASPIYLKNQIPVLTPLSTHTDVTQKNPWFFRTIFNDRSQSLYLSSYIHSILKQNQAILIQENNGYGKDVAQHFRESFQSKGGKLIVHETLKPLISFAKKENLKMQIMSVDSKTPIFLGTHLDLGLEILTFIRKAGLNNPFILPDIFDAKRFVDTISQLEKEDSSFNAKDIYVLSPLLFQTASKTAHDFYTAYECEYNEQPDWVSAYSYDAALTLVETIDKKNICGKLKNLQQERKTIKDTLYLMNHPSRGILGVTGWIYFDKYGDTNKQLTMGKYHRSKIMPAMIQPMAAQWIDKTFKENSSIVNESRIIFNGTEMILANMIYTSVLIKNVRNINIEDGTATLDFEISFHYTDERSHPERLLFLNATQKELPLILRDKKISNNEIWATYEGHGNFFIDRFPGIYVFNQHQVGIQFQHKLSPISHLIYINDENVKINKTSVEFSDIIQPLSGWMATGSHAFQDFEIKTTLGNPQFLHALGGKMGFSRFNHGVSFKKSRFSFRGLFSGLIAWRIFWISLICFILSMVISQWPKTLWGVMTLSAYGVIISVESLITYGLAPHLTDYQLQWIDMGFDILWWIAPAFFLNIFIRRFIFMPINQKNGLHVANIVPRFLGFLIYLIAGLGVIAFVFDQEISKLLATGGVFAMMIGLAVKMNVADIISGIAINLEAPFRLGDWIKIDAFEGVVTDITWRSTRIKTGENAILCIPNSKATESSIQNFNTPGEMNWIKINVPVSHHASPESVDNILMASVLATREVITDPIPKIFYKGATELNAWFEVFFCIKDYANRKIRIDNVWTSIWKHLQYAEMQLSLMGQTLSFPQLKLFDILDSLDILNGVSKQDKLELVPHFQKRFFDAGKIIVDHKKAISDTFYIIRKGAVRVYLPSDDGEMIEVDRMGAGDYFGETGLLGEEYATQIKASTNVLIDAISGDTLFECVDDREPFLNQLRHLRLKRMINRENQKCQYEDEQAEKEKQTESIFFRLLKWITPKRSLIQEA
ncbi:membrane protein containing Mechanosensitive ion channel MscS [Candidatus Magnetomorum sp. HK-1]|nr:membrane protein containing Mechanosensitive ion channel MscS [Candidatus Magnetomorum sp. HK-1]